jgi:F420-dependent oxidoreductase-like protein
LRPFVVDQAIGCPAVDLCLMIEGQENVAWVDWVAIARACEEHGVPGLYRSDHQLNLWGYADRGALDAWATISALGAITSTLRLGTLVSPVTFRHPSELAKVVTTADHVSGGRVELGLGAGWNEREHEAYGFPFPPVRERMERLAEQLEIVHGHWDGQPFSFTGRHYELQQLEALPKPVQRPRPHIIVGGAAGPRGAALAARWADEYNTVGPTLDEVRERRERIAAACEREGREPIPLSVMTQVVVGGTPGELRGRAQRLADRVGSDPDPDGLRAASPGAIVGTLDEAAEQLAALRDAGVHRVMLQNLLHTELDVVEIIGRELAPRLA